MTSRTTDNHTALLAIRAMLYDHDADMAECPINNGTMRGLDSRVCPRCTATDRQPCGIELAANYRFIATCRAAFLPDEESDGSSK